MPPRSSFRGFLRLSLVSVPVRGFTSTRSGAEIRLNQLHKDCHNRVRYKKVCPEHGELATDEIVSGYEHAKDSWVVIDPAEVQKIRKQSEKTVDILGFVPASDIDPMYFSGRMLYLTPDGAAGQKPYQLLTEAMVQDGLYAVGTAILGGREQIVAVRPIDGVLGMSVLTYAEKVKQPSEFSEEITDAKLTKAEKDLTKTLVEASTLSDFDINEYKDGYVGELRQLIDMKIEGQEIVAAPDPEEPKVVNLMEALKASVEGAKKTNSSRKASSKVSTKMAPSAKARGAAKRKRKAG